MSWSRKPLKRCLFCGRASARDAPRPFHRSGLSTDRRATQIAHGSGVDAVTLSQKGYLDTARGRGGGIGLSRKSSEINIGDVVRDTEEELDVLGCLREPGYCRIERARVLRAVVRDASRAFFTVFDRHALADLIKPQKALVSSLR